MVDVKQTQLAQEASEGSDITEHTIEPVEDADPFGQLPPGFG
jgi:hypothetical protein